MIGRISVRRAGGLDRSIILNLDGFPAVVKQSLSTHPASKGGYDQAPCGTSIRPERSVEDSRWPQDRGRCQADPGRLRGQASLRAKRWP